MTTKPSPLATHIVTRAFESGLKMKAVLKQAKVGRATWWRITVGKDFRGSTIDRMDQAITDLIAQKETADVRSAGTD